MESGQNNVESYWDNMLRSQFSILNSQFSIKLKMKFLIILGDGMADWPVESLQNKTLLQHANTPYMDMLARMGRNGLLATVPDGFHPGSEVANLSILGYNLPEVFEGRAVLEAAAMGVEIEDDELAFRCNLICVEDEKIKNHSAGHISTEEAREIIASLQEWTEGTWASFHPGVSYRHLLKITTDCRGIVCAPPHDMIGKRWEDVLPIQQDIDSAGIMVQLLGLMFETKARLKDHPVNLRRIAEGKDPANMIWPWSPGKKPKMKKLSEMYPNIKSGAVISAVDLIHGIGIYAGLKSVHVEGATGLYDTNYENKVAAALEALKTDDFVYLHIEASDEAGHEGDVALKLKTIENLDSRVIGPIYEAVKNWDEPVAIAVLPDHPTPCELRTHTNEPIPFLIWYPGIEPDGVQVYDEAAAKAGAYGLLKEDEFMKTFINTLYPQLTRINADYLLK